MDPISLGFFNTEEKTAMPLLLDPLILRFSKFDPKDPVCRFVPMSFFAGSLDTINLGFYITEQKTAVSFLLDPWILGSLDP